MLKTGHYCPVYRQHSQNMKYWIFMLLTSLLLPSCLSDQSDELPIDEDKAVLVMFDVHIAEAAMAKMQAGDSKDSLANEYYEQVAEIHGMDRTTLDTCIAILQRDPELATTIYEKVMEMAEKKKLGK